MAVRDIILIFAGTTAAGVGLEFERKRAQEIRRLTDRLKVSGFADVSELMRRLEDLRDGIQVLPLDVDITGTYQLNAPLDNLCPNWPIGVFVTCALPGPDLVDRVREGREPGRFEFMNAEAVAALSGQPDASGGVRPNGWLCVEANRARITEEIRRRFATIITRRRTVAGPQESRVRVVLTAGSFGGFGSGAFFWLRNLIGDVAKEWQLDIEMTSLLLYPV
jgi:hypothetical protein